MKHVRQFAVVLIQLLCVLAATNGRAEKLPLLWAVSDDTLSAPLGAIVDVAVGADRIVYLLDSQTCVVRRFAPDGTELPAVGGPGEGPGEFMHPRLIAANRDGCCIVIQDFFGPAVCLTAQGIPCSGPDLSHIRDSFLMTQFVATARCDSLGRLLVAALTADSDMAPRSESALSVFRLDPKTGASVLFTDNESLLGNSTVPISGRMGHFVYRCWDVNRSGQVLYADPDGEYRVFVGHPADGSSRTVELPTQEGDEAALRHIASSNGVSWQELPTIADVLWLDDRRFLVQPGARATAPSVGLAGTFELFNQKGDGYGRRTLQGDFDPTFDSIYIRGSLVVIIKGGRSAMETSLGMRTNSHRDEPATQDAMTILAYDLAELFLHPAD